MTLICCVDWWPLLWFLLLGCIHKTVTSAIHLIGALKAPRPMHLWLHFAPKGTRCLCATDQSRLSKPRVQMCSCQKQPFLTSVFGSVLASGCRAQGCSLPLSSASFLDSISPYLTHSKGCPCPKTPLGHTLSPPSTCRHSTPAWETIHQHLTCDCYLKSYALYSGSVPTPAFKKQMRK